jgi:cytochrome b561
MRDTPYGYGLVSKVLHWVIGILLIGVWVVGSLMEDIPMPDKIQIIGIHKAMGAVILFLALLRALWRAVYKLPKMPAGIPPLQRLVARAVHVAFYPLCVLMPLSGWLMSNAAGYPVSVFGLFNLPTLTGKDEALKEFFGEMHEVFAWALLALTVMHVGAALHHHFIKGNKLIKRML